MPRNRKEVQQLLKDLSAKVCQAEKRQPTFRQRRVSIRNNAKYISEKKPKAEQAQDDNTSASDFVFKTRTSKPSKVLPTTPVRINGIKGQVEAETCSTANIIDEERFELLKMLWRRK